jgi:hypothetical protein
VANNSGTAGTQEADALTVTGTDSGANQLTITDSAGAVAVINLVGGESATTVATDIATQLTAAGFTGVTAVGDVVDYTYLTVGQTGLTISDASEAITANGYQTVNLDSPGTGLGANTTYLVDNALASLVITGKEDLTLATSPGGHPGALASITTTGAAAGLAINLTGVLASEVTTGITATLGAADVTITGNAATGSTDVFTGSGSSHITGTTGGGNSDITFTDGVLNTVDVTLTTGTANVVSLGNGTDDLVNLSTGAAAATVTLGTGLGDDVLFGTGLATVTYGAHTSSTLAGFDTANFTDVSSPSYLTPTTTSQVSVLTSHIDIVTGLVSGDHIILPAADAIVTGGGNGAGIAGDASFASGTYSAAAGTFSFGASGHDTLLTYDSTVAHTGVYVSVVLVGTSVTSHATHAGDVITLA